MNKLAMLLIVIICVVSFTYSQDVLTYTVSSGFNLPHVLQTDRSSIWPSDFLEVGILYRWTEPISVSAAIGVHRWDDLDMNLLRPAIDVPLLFGLRWQMLEASVSPYISTEAGVHFVSRKYYEHTWIMTSENSATATSTRIQSESVFKLGYRIGLGLSLVVTDRFQMDIGARYETIHWHVLSDDPFVTKTEAPVQINAVMSFHVGF